MYLWGKSVELNGQVVENKTNTMPNERLLGDSPNGTLWKSLPNGSWLFQSNGGENIGARMYRRRVARRCRDQFTIWIVIIETCMQNRCAVYNSEGRVDITIDGFFLRTNSSVVAAFTWLTKTIQLCNRNSTFYEPLNLTFNVRNSIEKKNLVQDLTMDPIAPIKQKILKNVRFRIAI